MTAGLLVACQAGATTRTAQGVIIDVRVRDIARAESIRVRTDDGRELELNIGESVRFPPSHLREHMLFADPVTVTYTSGSDGSVATEITDPGH